MSRNRGNVRSMHSLEVKYYFGGKLVPHLILWVATPSEGSKNRINKDVRIGTWKYEPDSKRCHLYETAKYGMDIRTKFLTRPTTFEGQIHFLLR